MKIVTVLGANPIFRQMMQAFERCSVKSLEDFPRHIHSLFLVLGIQFRWVLMRGNLAHVLVSQADLAIDNATHAA